ncbi:glycosyl transferase family 90, partial [Mesonia sp.]|uniref:glycosyl transferase family 90 n=1 Tax=Mesonia sp. TaxID=1960830 RepID=UPI001776FEF7
MDFKRLSGKHKNNKLYYYAINYWRYFASLNYSSKNFHKKLENLSYLDFENILARVNYYHRVDNYFQLSENSSKLQDIELKKGSKTYFFDLYEYARYFNKNHQIDYLFGDIKNVPHSPTLVKSRPIIPTNQNSILLKWNKIRHFTFIKKDSFSYKEKKNEVVWRGKVHTTQPQRIKLVKKFFDHSSFNVGKVNPNTLANEWTKPRMTIEEQLAYKFILSVEGNDVASNLKWIMSSNSIAVMPTPKYETWFMEGKLIADYHYIHIKDDYSNLEEKINYYLEHPNQALAIINNANNYIKEFQNKDKEDLVSLLV